MMHSPHIALDLTGAAVAATLAAGAVIFANGMFNPRSSLLTPTIWRGDDAAKDAGRIALTFDDGPWPGSTETILDQLNRVGAKATFFVIGRYAVAQPDLIRRIHAEGHLVANHTFDHDRAGLFRGTTYWTDQIQRTDDAIHSIIGERPQLFRPPMGFKSPRQASALRQSGHTVVTWSRRGRDGLTTTPQAIIQAVGSPRGGDVILLHDGRDPASQRPLDATAQALPTILQSVLDAGLTPARIDEVITSSKALS